MAFVVSLLFFAGKVDKSRYTRPMLRRLLVLIAIVCSCAALVAGQSSKSKDSKKAQPEIPKVPVATLPLTPEITEYVAKNFGPEFSLIQRYPVLTGDLDSDGTEDAVIVLTRKGNPMLDEEEFNYKVVDPYDKYFGFGDPSVTTNFNSHDPQEIKHIAIIHDWRAAEPKLKLIVINLPFEKLSLTKIVLKKKKYPALTAEELGGTTSAIYWDGKQYKWNSMSGID